MHCGRCWLCHKRALTAGLPAPCLAATAPVCTNGQCAASGGASEGASGDTSGGTTQTPLLAARKAGGGLKGPSSISSPADVSGLKASGLG